MRRRLSLSQACVWLARCGVQTNCVCVCRVQNGEFSGSTAYIRLCAEWVRAIMVAHQRRGESDAVAYWLVQLLALDPSAPEWDFVLTQYMQPEIRLGSFV